MDDELEIQSEEGGKTMRGREKMREYASNCVEKNGENEWSGGMLHIYR